MYGITTLQLPHIQAIHQNYIQKINESPVSYNSHSDSEYSSILCVSILIVKVLSIQLFLVSYSVQFKWHWLCTFFAFLFIYFNLIHHNSHKRNLKHKLCQFIYNSHLHISLTVVSYEKIYVFNPKVGAALALDDVVMG